MEGLREANVQIMRSFKYVTDILSSVISVVLCSESDTGSVKYINDICCLFHKIVF